MDQTLENSQTGSYAKYMTEIHGSGDLKTPNPSIDSGNGFDGLKFISEDEADKAKASRDSILRDMAPDTVFRHKRTKLLYGGMSRGCELCGAGTWSCLFINSKCNCHCFYCPAQQNSIGVPTTNTLNFARIQDYLDYIQQFEFEGVSFSGGEPLLTPDTTLKFLSAVKKKFGDRVYVWLYTNGTLVDRDILLRLGDAGLNEIRFDIGATEYSLKKAEMAVGTIDHVTVEIPAVPEEENLLKNKLREMSDRGISYLNLHQLRLTRYNRPNLSVYNYTYLRGEHPTVLESELTALKLLRHAAMNRIPLAINYCSYVYKNRFQRMAARRRCGVRIRKPYEDVTESGYIRSLCVKGPPERIESAVESLNKNGCRTDAWYRPKQSNQIFFSAEVWPFLSMENLQLWVSYFDSRMVSSISYRNPFIEIQLNRNRSVFMERIRATEDIEVPEPLIMDFQSHALDTDETGNFPNLQPFLKDLIRYEKIAAEFQDYA